MVDLLDLLDSSTAAHPNEIDQINSFLNESVDERTGVYTHSKQKFDAIKPAVLTVYGDYFNASKRVESEADALGARICGVLGLTRPAFVSGQKDVTRTSPHSARIAKTS